MHFQKLYFLQLSFTSSLPIFVINPLSNEWWEYIFSKYRGCIYSNNCVRWEVREIVQWARYLPCTQLTQVPSPAPHIIHPQPFQVQSLIEESEMLHEIPKQNSNNNKIQLNLEGCPSAWIGELCPLENLRASFSRDKHNRLQQFFRKLIHVNEEKHLCTTEEHTKILIEYIDSLKMPLDSVSWQFCLCFPQYNASDIK